MIYSAVNSLEVILLVVMAFLPPIIYAIWIRNTEKYNRERWWPIIFCFIWGATIAVIAAIILEIIFGILAMVFGGIVLIKRKINYRALVGLILGGINFMMFWYLFLFILS